MKGCLFPPLIDSKVAVMLFCQGHRVQIQPHWRHADPRQPPPCSGFSKRFPLLLPPDRRTIYHFYSWNETRVQLSAQLLGVWMNVFSDSETPMASSQTQRGLHPRCHVAVVPFCEEYLQDLPGVCLTPHTAQVLMKWRSRPHCQHRTRL